MRRFVSTAGILGVLLIVVGVAGTAHVATAIKPQPPPPPRFVDNGDGTITDAQTGLMWEQKTGTVGTFVFCTTVTTCLDPTHVNNIYTWSWSGTAPDGALFTDFLAKMNCTVLQNGGTCGPGLHSDWRIPTNAELQTILAPCPGGGAPCIDPIFGPTAAAGYWSSTSNVAPLLAWGVNFFVNGSTSAGDKTSFIYARAVRGGS